jgi:hypothetical protein
MEEGAEVDDHVEGFVGEGHPADIGSAELRLGPVLAKIRRRLDQQLRIDVQAHQQPRAAQPIDYRQSDPSPASHLEDSFAARNSQRPHHRRDLQLRLPGIPPFLVGEGLVLGRRVDLAETCLTRHRLPPVRC